MKKKNWDSQWNKLKLETKVERLKLAIKNLEGKPTGDGGVALYVANKIQDRLSGRH